MDVRHRIAVGDSDRQEWEGIVRRTFIEPSIGSMTTRCRASPPPSVTSPRSSLTAESAAPAAAMRSSSSKTMSSHCRSSFRSCRRPRRAPRIRSARRCRGSGEQVRLPGGHPPACIEPIDLGLHAGNGIGAWLLRRPSSRASLRLSRWRERSHDAVRRGLAIGPGLGARPRHRGLGHGPSRSPSQGSPRWRPRHAAGADHPAHPDRGQPGRRLRDRIAELLGGPSEEIWIETWPGFARATAARYALEAGIDPFFEVRARRPAGASPRPTRRAAATATRDPRQPSGLLAGLLERIDALKAEGIGPAELRDLARPPSAGAARSSARWPSASSSSPSSSTATTPSCCESGGSTRPTRPRARPSPHRHPDLRAAIAAFPFMLVDELEDAAGADRLVPPLPRTAMSWRPRPDAGAGAPGDGGGGRRAGFLAASRAANGSSSARRRPPDGALARGTAAGPRPPLPDPARRPAVPEARARAWGPALAVRQRARQAQAVARETEHLIAWGSPPEEVCILVAGSAASTPARRGRVRGARRPVPRLRPGGSLPRPEVRDAIAWLRVLADPTTRRRRPGADPAAGRAALGRPRPLTTIARRRKLDMVSAGEAALESPQIRPEARERIQSFLKLYRAAPAAMEDAAPTSSCGG